MNFSRYRKIVRLRNQMNQSLTMNPFVFSRLFFLWAGLGALGGVMAGVYWLILEFFMESLHGIGGLWVIPLMAAGGLLAGLVIHFIGDPGEMQLIVNNIRFKGGRLDYRNNPSMILSSLVCIAVGGSLGPEAPLVQVTGSTGTWLARKLKLKGEDVRSLTIAGMASGFTALFGAPLGGSLFSLEILHHKYVVEYYQALIPAIVASCTSFLVFLLITSIGLGPTWDFPVYGASSSYDFLWAIVFGALAAAIGWLFIYAVRSFKAIFKKTNWPIFIKTTVGGLFLGTIAYYLPITRYFSHHEINGLISGNFSLYLLGGILLAKVLAIAITVTSGWRGGFIIPLFFVGATLGLLIHQFLPNQNLSLMMVCCMAAINACVTRTPISTIILLSTMTGFGHFIPIMFAALTGFFLAPKTPLIGAQLQADPKP